MSPLLCVNSRISNPVIKWLSSEFITLLLKFSSNLVKGLLFFFFKVVIARLYLRDYVTWMWRIVGCYQVSFKQATDRNL